MPLLDLHVGPFSAVYVGMSDTLDVLTRLSGLTTDDQTVLIDQPEIFNYTARNSLPSGPVTIQVSLTFLSDDEEAWRLAYGNFLDTAFQDSSSEFVTLTLLLVHPDEDAEASFLFPTCYARKTVKTNYSKKTATILPISFFWQDANRFDNIYYKRSADDLGTILGVRSPF